jgi:hypothetical protein
MFKAADPVIDLNDVGESDESRRYRNLLAAKPVQALAVPALEDMLKVEAIAF